ncbi:MAG: 16S rRNA (guanine(966)-N(2))-methyltransferase RsmD [Rhodovarius sp.]|nr:16S rRNA (guanine(966)-N(2))-methyltransferase RsmD [Rhodovarius sp.]
MRILAGRHRGRRLLTPPGQATRPTSGRVRQALFDMLWHAPWGGRHALEGVRVLDAFAGSGALGLEALSRGAAHATFFETAAAARAVLAANIAALGEQGRSQVLPADATRPPAAPAPCGLIFLDPPYRQGLVPAALAALAASGWVAAGALICVETGREEHISPPWPTLAERCHGAARLLILRAP